MPTEKNYPLFVQTQRSAEQILTAAGTINAAGTPAGTPVRIAKMGAAGGLISKLRANAVGGNTTGCYVNIFASKDSGTTLRPIGFINVPGYTASTAVAPVAYYAEYSEDATERREALDEIWIGLSSAQASGINVSINWGDF